MITYQAFHRPLGGPCSPVVFVVSSTLWSTPHLVKGASVWGGSGKDRNLTEGINDQNRTVILGRENKDKMGGGAQGRCVGKHSRQRQEHKKENMQKSRNANAENKSTQQSYVDVNIGLHKTGVVIFPGMWMH